ncbi:Cytidylate kinase [Geodia barretti]|uniref:(d)CMP kinase n=1 Tax=Geodia barretti TaxID=519541 RepID=A0AA35SE80_GEOBA|nr:Cytidylate kinase [Geodia barretti]
MRIADALGIRFLDSGAMYRAVTLAALRGSVSLSDDDALTTAPRRVLLDGEDVTDRLRDPEVEGAVSRVAAVAGVRHVLVSKQQAVARTAPSSWWGATSARWCFSTPTLRCSCRPAWRSGPSVDTQSGSGRTRRPRWKRWRRR